MKTIFIGFLAVLIIPVILYIFGIISNYVLKEKTFFFNIFEVMIKGINGIKFISSLAMVILFFYTIGLVITKLI